MKEIEVKFEVDDFVSIIKKLQQLGARKVWDGNEKNFFFDWPSGKLRKTGKMIRLREWSGHSISVTLKEKIDQNGGKYKIRNEFELQSPNMKTARAFLEALGLEQTTDYIKSRQHWRAKGTFVELDEVCGRCFVEIEGSKKRINKMASLLGLDWNRATTQSYVKIIDEAGQKK